MESVPAERSPDAEDLKPEQSSGQDTYTIGQRYRISAVYELLARALPTEGRDYAIKFSFPGGPSSDSVSVGFEAYTEIGRIWCDYCRKVLRNGGAK